MKRNISNKLSARLSHFSPDQIEQLIARAKAMRSRSASSSAPLDIWIERVLNKDEKSFARAERRVDGLIVKATSQGALAETSEGFVVVRLLGRPVVVGDEVTIAFSSNAEGAVIDVKPRRTKLSRPDVGGTNREQVIVANVEVVVIVVSVVAPPLHPRLIDRYLVAVQQGGATPTVFVNKLDLLDDRTELGVLEPYRKLGIAVLLGSALSPGGGQELRAAIAGKTCAFVGHSGVGKSSLVNALKPNADLETRSVSEGYGRGTHTTTSSSLHRLCDGTVLMDTPGIRSFGLRALDSNEIKNYFPEFEALDCRFRDCSHTHEPSCGVIAALEQGAIDQARYDTYCRLKEELM